MAYLLSHNAVHCGLPAGNKKLSERTQHAKWKPNLQLHILIRIYHRRAVNYVLLLDGHFSAPSEQLVFYFSTLIIKIHIIKTNTQAAENCNDLKMAVIYVGLYDIYESLLIWIIYPPWNAQRGNHSLPCQCWFYFTQDNLFFPSQGVTVNTELRCGGAAGINTSLNIHGWTSLLVIITFWMQCFNSDMFLV